MEIVEFYCYQGKSLMSWLIKIRTLSKYSHIAIRINGIFYEAWTCNGVNGVVKSISPLTYHSKNTKIEIIDVPMRNMTEWKNFLEDQVGKKYDWKAIFNFIFNWDKNNTNEWFCSELADTFFKFETPQFVFDDGLVSPGKFVAKITSYKLGLYYKK